MATATSAVNAFVANLMTLVTAAMLTIDTTGAILVVEGPPGPNQPDDLVVIAEEINQQYVAHALVGTMGSQSLMEQFAVSVGIDCYRGGETFATTRARCMTLAQAVDDVVRNDPQVSSTPGVWKAWPSTHGYTSSWDEDHKGTRVVCRMYITVESLP